MPKPNYIELDEADIVIPILYEDRSVLALDKPAGWLLAPDTWDETGRNLQLALQSSLNNGDYWARSRNLKYLRFVHRLDAETSGVILFAKSPGALRSYSELFETRQVEKRYLTVVHGLPQQTEWTCSLPLMADPNIIDRMIIAPVAADRVIASTPDDDSAATPSPRPLPSSLVKDAVTHFRVLGSLAKTTLVEAHPITGRTHQIRVHLSASGHPVVGDPLYGSDKAAVSKGRQKLALRARRLAFRDPFQKRPVWIEAPVADFVREYGFDPHLVLVAPPKPRA